MIKKTKIIATIGPASSDPTIIDQLMTNGVDVFRINFSHGSKEVYTQQINNIRAIAEKQQKIVAIMGDLQGPKIRVAKFKMGKVELNTGDTIILDCKYKELGDAHKVGVDYANLAQDVKIGDTLLLDDGKLSFTVIQVNDAEIHCHIKQGGTLSNNKGINKMGGGLTAPALTTKDFADIQFAASVGVDYLAVSFVRDASDIILTRNLLATYNVDIPIIAKIERVEAISNLEQIVQIADGVMVARGDLSVEVGDAQVPGLQKKIILCAQANHKLSIVATQMLESMIVSPVATRAEISDIANAVLDGTDAVMLSAETASGTYPVDAVATMSRTCIEAEKNRNVAINMNFTGQKFHYIDQAIAMSALFTGYHLQAKAIISLTTSGKTALWLSRVNSGIPVYAVTESIHAARQMALYRDVHPLCVPGSAKTIEELLNLAKEILTEHSLIGKGDRVLLTMGNHLHKIGGTNTMQILQW